MPRLGLFFDGTLLNDPPMNDPAYRVAYNRLASEFTDLHGEFFLARGYGSYAGGQRFRRGWKFQEDDWLEIREPFEVDLIYNKGGPQHFDASAAVVNPPELDTICRNKWLSYERFPDLFPKTFLLSSPSDTEHALNAIPTARVVVKPLSRYGGEGIIIGATSDIRNATLSFPCILQAFVDTSRGIPGITGKHHDFRFVIMDGEALLSFVRTPPPGSLISNVARGGSVRIVAAKDRPKEAVALAATVDAAFHDFQERLYCIDCALGADGKWMLIELNPEPGLMTPEECGEYAEKYYRDLAAFLFRHCSGS